MIKKSNEKRTGNRATEFRYRIKKPRKELCKKHGLSNFIYTFGLFRNIPHIHFHNGL